MKTQPYHYIIEFDTGCYLKDLSGVTDQLRLAKMYNSTKYAHEGAKSSIKKLNKYISPDSPYYIRAYRLLKVRIEVYSDYSEEWMEVE